MSAKFGFDSETFMDESSRQPENAACPIQVTELGISKEVKLVQYLNAPAPIVVTELGISTDVKPVSENAKSLIEATELGITIDFKPVQ